MFGKKILLLLGGYVAGNAIASKYSGAKKKGKDAENPQDVQELVKNFLNTQKRFISDIEKKYLSEENKQILLEKKQDFLKFAEKYTQEGQKILHDIQVQERLEDGKQKAQSFFYRLKSKFLSFKSDASDDIDQAEREVQDKKEKLIVKGEEMKSKVKQETQDVKKKGKKLVADGKKIIKK